MSRRRPPLVRIGLLERVRLWISYQRYGLLLVGGSMAAVAAVIALAPHAWWAWGVLALATLPLVRFGITVLGRWPRKLAATLIAEHRIRRGRFRVEQVRPYCADPCFRVVAREILDRAGIARDQQKTLVARFCREQQAADRMLMLVDREHGRLVIVDGDGHIREESCAPLAQ